MKEKFFAKVIVLLLLFVFTTPVSVLASTLKFAQVSDIHYQPKAPENEKSFKLKYYTMKILDDALKQIDEDKDVKFILVTGDAADKPIAEDFDYMYKYLNAHSPRPWYYQLGNHDVSPKGLKRADQMKLLYDNGQKQFKDKTYYSFKPKRDMVFIGVDATYDNKSTPQGYLPPEQIKYIDKVISQNPKDVVVIFLHHPLTYPAKASDHNVVNDFAIKEMLKKHDNPILILGGHFHACKIEQYGNILMVASPAIVSYPNAFRFITIDNKKDKTTFVIDYRETNLKDIQAIGKQKLTFGHAWIVGSASDRLTTVVMDKKCKNK